MKNSVSLVVLCCCLNICAKENIIILNSDEASYIDDLLKCSKNVKVRYKEKIISADEITYSKTKEKITAKGNVVIEDKNTKFLMDEVDVYKNFKSGKAKNLKVILSDGSRLAAKDSEIKDGKYNLKDVVYTPCTEEVCNNSLTWVIKSQEVLFDPEKNTTYSNAYFNVLGKDILYAPYFSHVSGGVQSKSGFLTPKISTSGDSGFSMNIPYLWVISASDQLIIKPVFTTKLGSVMWADYKKRFKNGEFQVSGSITGTHSVKKINPSNKEELENIKKIKSSGYRAHLNSRLNYLISNTSLFRYDINLVSDDYYLKRFPFFSWTDRAVKSEAALENCDKLDYFGLRSYYFTKSGTKNLPLVTPLLEKNMRFDVLNGTLNLEGIFMNLSFHNRKHAQKMVVRTKWEKSFLMPLGIILDFNALIAANSLHVSEKERTDYDSFFSVMPQLNMALSWPIVGKSEDYKCIVTPKVAAIISRNEKDIDIVEKPFNELVTSNLFEGSRSISSYDVDSGGRIVYACKFSFYKLDEYLGNFIIGRSLEITRVDDTNKLLLKNKLSNIIASLDAVLKENINLIGNYSYSTRHNSWAKIETGFRFLYENFYFDILGFKGDQSKLSNFLKSDLLKETRYKGIVVNGSFQVQKKWTYNFSMTFGNSNAKLMKHSIGVLYKNECTSVEFVFERLNFRAGDLKPNNSIRLVIHLKNLGI